MLEALEPRVFLSSHRSRVSLPRPDHVVIVIEENHSYEDLFAPGSTEQIPYLRSLAAQGALFTNSFAVTHPSQPNYLALFGGSTFGVTSDDYLAPARIRTPSLGGELLSAGDTFGGYSEDLPRPGFTGDTAKFYDKKHNPWSDFRDVPAKLSVPMTSFPRANRLNRLPTVSFVIPNENDNMHDGSPAAADNWLSAHLDPYVQWAKTHNSLLIVTWDEDDTASNNHIPTLFVGPMVKPGQYAQTITHYNVLRTVEDMYRLAHVGLSAKAGPITNVWTT